MKCVYNKTYKKSRTLLLVTKKLGILVSFQKFSISHQATKLRVHYNFNSNQQQLTGVFAIVTAILVELTIKAVKNGFFSFGNFEYITVLAGIGKM